jgi:hypothetical protein
MFRKAFIILVLVTLIIEAGAAAAGFTKATATESGSYTANACTSEHGQLLIDQGHYEDAIEVFTCIIEAQPTEVRATAAA